jgi:hypothetical protein
MKWMALTPEHGWVFLVICRFFVGFGVTGLYTVDIAVVQDSAFIENRKSKILINYPRTVDWPPQAAHPRYIILFDLRTLCDAHP